MVTDEHTLTISSGEQSLSLRLQTQSTEKCSLFTLIPGKSRNCDQRSAVDLVLEHQREKLMMAASPTFSIMVLFLECLPFVGYH
jgi:hypothetical protein